MIVVCIIFIPYFALSAVVKRHDKEIIDNRETTNALNCKIDKLKKK